MTVKNHAVRTFTWAGNPCIRIGDVLLARGMMES